MPRVELVLLAFNGALVTPVVLYLFQAELHFPGSDSKQKVIGLQHLLMFCLCLRIPFNDDSAFMPNLSILIICTRTFLDLDLKRAEGQMTEVKRTNEAVLNRR